MKAMILAAGRGERMLPLTEHTPKPLLCVGGKPLIQYHVENLVAAGFTELVINVSWLGDQIEAFFAGRDMGCTISWSREAEPLETAGGIVQALPLLGGDRFAVVNGDIWTDYPLQGLRQAPEGGAHLVLTENPAQHPAGDFCLQADGMLVPRDADPAASSTYTGLGVYSVSMFAQARPGKQALLPFLQAAMAQGRLSGEHYSGKWFDVGTPDRLAALDASLGIH